MEALSNDLHKKFESDQYFQGGKFSNLILFCFNIFILVGLCIVTLLQQNLLEDAEQRLAAITLLHELYRGEPIANTPFSNVFIQLLVRNFLSLNG